jgi:ERCC4-type nuclease
MKRKVKFMPFTVAIDTREQTPFAFDSRMMEHERGRFIWTKKTTLKTGDYSIVGLENEITIERKSIYDLFNTLSQGRERFEKEFERMKEFAFSAVVIEGDMRMILNPIEYDPLFPSQLHPHSVIGTIQSWSIKYSTHWVLCPSRAIAENWTFSLLEKFWRYKNNI